ncbi:unnamed protein product [Ilex paraguariensis]|uniref:Uncharacterized protein n=1 Tax=Ilex paraguariensis TaxID=185542 RepID=A0ABC8UDV1_9AQUA
MIIRRIRVIGQTGITNYSDLVVFLIQCILPSKMRKKKISGWCEFIGYIGSISLKFRNLRRIGEDEASLTASIEIAVARGIGCGEEEEKLRKLGEKKTMKRLSTVQDLADGLMALADIRDGKGWLSEHKISIFTCFL